MSRQNGWASVRPAMNGIRLWKNRRRRLFLGTWLKKQRRETEPGRVRLAEISMESNERILTGMGELDRVLGGGIIKGSLVLMEGIRDQEVDAASADPVEI